jgi:hypothetical protein
MLRFLLLVGIALLPANAGWAQPADEIFPHASLEEICGKLVTDNLPVCLGKKNQYDQQYNSCVQYGVQAWQVFILKGDGKPEGVTRQMMTPKATGLNGLSLVEHLVVAAYHGSYGSTPAEFSEYAFKLCMKNQPF